MLYALYADMREDETQAAELWRRTLAQVSSLFGRLAYLASLKDANTGAYLHFGLVQQLGDLPAERTIRRSHVNTFADWLCLSLEQQKQQVEDYLDALEADKRQILSNWLAAPPFITWIPVETSQLERDLFTADLEIVLELLRTEFAVVSPAQSASRRRSPGQ